jgi:hypothetical protein
MRYLLFVCTDPSAEAYDPAGDNIREWVGQLDAAGKRIFGERLEPVEKALTVRKRKGKVLVTNGPFAETKEWIGGFDLLECDSMDEAVEIAGRHPMARFGRIEVRALLAHGPEVKTV